MSLRSRARSGLVLALAVAGLLAPRSAAPSGVGTLFDTLPCPEILDVPARFDFQDSFVGLVDCLRLCADAGLVCKRAVQDAVACQTQVASDWIAADSRLDCDGLTGVRLRDCKAGWALDKRFWLAVIKSDANGALNGFGGCAQQVNSCARLCTGT
jgi:hypothetical protein